MRPRFHWYMKGVGYGHPEYGHGRYHGGPAQLFEEYALAEVDDAMNLHIQAICDVSMEGIWHAPGQGCARTAYSWPPRP